MRVQTPWRAAMKVISGFMWPPVTGSMAMMKRKRLRKTATGTTSKGSATCEVSAHATQPMSENIRNAVATDSARAALHN